MALVNGDSHFTLYYVSTALTANKRDASIIDSGASTTFVTSDSYLTNPMKHKTSIVAANGKGSVTKSQVKYKIAGASNPIYLSALSAPDFTQNLVSVGQLAMKHNVLFTKEGCYLLSLSAAPPKSHILRFRGKDNLYKMNKQNKLQPAAPATAPVVKDLNLHNIINLRKSGLVSKRIPRGRPMAIAHIRKMDGDDGGMSL